MKILLVCPECPDIYWSFRYAMPFIGKRAAFPPLGILTVAAMLPECWDLRLIDMNVDRLSDHDLLWADYVLYALAVIHDENMEGKLDTNALGIPKEGYGFSNTAKAVTGAPSFSDASFSYDGKDLDMTISLHYLGFAGLQQG